MCLAESTIFILAIAHAMNSPTPMGGRKIPIPMEAMMRIP